MKGRLTFKEAELNGTANMIMILAYLVIYFTCHFCAFFCILGQELFAGENANINREGRYVEYKFI